MSPATVTAPPWTVVMLGRPLTVNNVYGKLHHHARAKAVAQLRKDAGLLLRAAHVPRSIGEPIAVTSQVVLPDRRHMTDPGAELPVAKATIDALVDCGAIPDDDGEWVRSLTFLPCAVEPDTGAPLVRITIDLWRTP